jgi:hypothetical protein
VSRHTASALHHHAGITFGNLSINSVSLHQLRRLRQRAADTLSAPVKSHRSTLGNRTLNFTTLAKFTQYKDIEGMDPLQTCTRAYTTSGYEELPMVVKPMSSRLTTLWLNSSASFVPQY